MFDCIHELVFVCEHDMKEEEILCYFDKNSDKPTLFAFLNDVAESCSTLVNNRWKT